MATQTDSAQALLDAVYSDLDFTAGALFLATNKPTSLGADDWITKGGWLSLARKVGAERIFFVEDNPVIVFVKDEPGKANLRHLFNRAWCMARPPLLFVAQPGTLSVFDLTQPPAGEDDDLFAPDRLLVDASQAAEVQAKLKDYHRAQIESGRLFEEHRFGFENRADHALIRDLAAVREKLINTGLSVPHAHALIGRSIFIRYLEDRRILTEDYFRRIARRNTEWRGILDNAPVHDGTNDDRRLYYAAVLSDKAFTHALFSRLAKEFNGDLFPFDEREQKAFTAPRLKLMQRFLLGKIKGPTLFTFAYDFDIIPIELISSMYEEFLRTEKGKPNTHGSFYTPGALVEFVLSQTLEDRVLNDRPRIVDPACGSAIFLVEAFRRLVRHRVCERGQRLRPDEVRKILRDQIAGIDVQPEAIRVAAFSLYLALLHYLEPPDILGHQLPNLIYSANRRKTDPNQHFDILLAANAFEVEAKVREPIRRRFTSGSADVMVGNPPWGFPKKPKKKDDEAREAATAEAWEAATVAMNWCQNRGNAVGDKELSQAFIHRTHDFLREGGRAGLLVSTGVFFKRQANSGKFREQWLAKSALDQVVNFAAVRDVFFASAIAPFASVVFEKRAPKSRSHRFRYYSAKKSAVVNELQVVRLSKPDLHIVRQSDFVADDELWKVYWWGGHRDQALVQALRAEETIQDLLESRQEREVCLGRGFEGSPPDSDSGWLQQYKELPTNLIERYGALDLSCLVKVPSKVYRMGNRAIYDGPRLLIRRGLSQTGNDNGRIVARLEYDRFCFRHSMYGMRLDPVLESVASVLLGILWSSLPRYFLWLTTGSWGMWHHEIHMEGIQRIPIRLPSNHVLRERIVRIVERLRAAGSPPGDMFSEQGTPQESQIRNIPELEAALDEAIFDLYELTGAERDAVCDMCDVGLELFYRGTKSDAMKPVPDQASGRRFGRHSDLPHKRSDQRGLDGYLDAFLEIWDAELKPSGRFQWRVIRPTHSSPMLAVVFSTEDMKDPQPPPTESDDAAWHTLLAWLAQTSSHPFGSKRLYIDGMTRIVGKNDIAIIKRNERRLWTRTAAREDAEATQLEAVHKQRALTRERAV
ncbi:MAG: N-6 DNA methylase [Phycisphaerae bacterium]|nr:N-6 DNA methylase [Phycisphaerae bacterium]